MLSQDQGRINVLPVHCYRIPHVATIDKHGVTAEKRRTMRNAYSSFQLIYHECHITQPGTAPGPLRYET